MAITSTRLNSSAVIDPEIEVGPQVIIQRLARKEITKEDANRSMQLLWDRAYEPSNFIRVLRKLFGKDSASHR